MLDRDASRTAYGEKHIIKVRQTRQREREFFIDKLLVRIHLIIVMIRWTGLAPWEFEFPLPGSLASTFLTRLASPPAPGRWKGLGLGLGF